MTDDKPNAVASNALLGGFVPAFFPDCAWCVLSPWIATLDGKPYRLHCANDLTEDEARHIAYQLERYAHPKEEATAYANAHTPNPSRQGAGHLVHGTLDGVVQFENNNP